MSQKLLDLFPNYSSTDSIFSKMVSFGAPWTSEVGKSMDISYFTMYSGIKAPTYFIISTLSPSGLVNSAQIAKVLWDMYGTTWTRLWDAYALKYSPIDNYNITENVTRDESNNREIDRKSTLSSSVEGTVNQTSNDNLTSTLQHGQTINHTGSTNQFNYGFNSETQVPVASSTEQSSDTHGGTDTTNDQSTGKVDTTSSDTRSDNTTDNTTDDTTISETLKRTRTGSLGHYSYQELLMQEFETWKWNFFTSVFDDCDKFLTLSIYDACLVN